jgi:hypothetical protein
MGPLNKNIEAALQSLEATEEDKEILASILYKEHRVLKEGPSGTTITNEIVDIIQSNMRGDEKGDLN